jgi:hypothetical protein
MSGKLFKLSRYFSSCYCNRERKPVIVKYDATATGTGIGTSDTNMKCPLCKQTRMFRIDTWWGGSFKNSDSIFLDTAKKVKFKVADAIDVTESLLTEYVKILDNDVLNKKNELKKAEADARNTKAVLDRIKGVVKKEGVKKKNG